MFKNKSRILTILILTSFMFGCTLQNNYKPTKTSLELQSIQKREFDTSYKIAFASTLSVFQDKGYIIETADSSTGFITASSPKNNKHDWIWTGSNTMNSVKATAFIETMPSKKTAIRLNFINYQEVSSAYGSKGQNSVPIGKARILSRCFRKHSKGNLC
jgi:hypothetical protein